MGNLVRFAPVATGTHIASSVRLVADERQSALSEVLLHAMSRRLGMALPPTLDEAREQVLSCTNREELAGMLDKADNGAQQFANPRELVDYLADAIVAELTNKPAMFVRFAAQLQVMTTDKLRILDVGAGMGTFAFLCRHILGHQVRSTDLPVFCHQVSWRMYGLDPALDLRIERGMPFAEDVLRRFGTKERFDRVAVHRLGGTGHFLPDAEKWQAPEWLACLVQLLKLLKPGGLLQLRDIAFGDPIFLGVVAALSQSPEVAIVEAGQDNDGKPHRYPSTDWDQKLYQLVIQRKP